MSQLVSPSKIRQSSKAYSAGIDIPAFMQSDYVDCAAIFSDLDGCLISGETVLPGARELTVLAGNRLWIVSNNSTDTAQSLAHKLNRLGLPVQSEQILLAGEATIRKTAKDTPQARIALYGTQLLSDLAVGLGLKPCRGEQKDLPQYALLTRDPAFTMRDLEQLMRLVDRDVPVILANPDLIHPAADGTPVPETGALFAALQAGFPKLNYKTYGKPSSYLVFEGLKRSGVKAADAVFIGDTPATDGQAALAAGVPFVLIQRPARISISIAERQGL